MKIGILISMINNFGEKGFYNSQEIGMAKALVSMGNEVTIYKLLARGSEIPLENNQQPYRIVYSTVNSVGINGLVDNKLIEKSLDVLIYYADTQLCVPRVAKWCRKNGVSLIPYVGVTKSHSTSLVIKTIIDTLFLRNISVFKKCICLVKNNTVAKELKAKGVERIIVAPVGIDIDLLKKDYKASSREMLLSKHGYEKDDKVLLFIGRLEDEKHPLDMVEIYEQLRKEDERYKLLVVGKGNLKDAFLKRIKKSKYKNEISYIERIPNNEIWELYRLCDCFVNLNRQEIFGMVLLEAMYYEAKVVAWCAPGPNVIIENGVSGYLVASTSELISAIKNKSFNGLNAHKRIMDKFTWGSTAQKVNSVAEKLVWGGGKPV